MSCDQSGRTEGVGSLDMSAAPTELHARARPFERQDQVAHRKRELATGSEHRSPTITVSA